MSTTDTRTRIHLADGQISAYGLACGYVQVEKIGPQVPDLIAQRVCEDPTITTQRWQVRMLANSATYDVVVWDHHPDAPALRAHWFQADTLTDARHLFRRVVAALRKAPEDAPASWKFTEEEAQA